MRKPSLGEQELELVRFLTEHEAMTTADIAEQFGTPRALARTTIHTMLERLRKKGFLTRAKDGSVYRYAASQQKHDVLVELVANFMQRTLHGSLKPIAAYLAHATDLREDELRELKAVVRALEAQEQGEGQNAE